MSDSQIIEEILDLSLGSDEELVVGNGLSLLQKEIPDRSYIIKPWLPEAAAAMIYAATGVGKTQVSMRIGWMVAQGSSFLKWHAPVPRNVLFIDGEMDLKLFQSRWEEICVQKEGIQCPANFYYINPDEQNDPLPDLCTAHGQEKINYMIEKHKIEFVILDNLSTLIPTMRENVADDWYGVQKWILKLRKKNISILIIHHTGKDSGKGNRGSSKQLDILNTVISLTRPSNHDMQEGARFEVIYKKSRGFWGIDALPFEAKLVTKNGYLDWIVTDTDPNTCRMIEIVKKYPKGQSIRKMAAEAQVPLSTFHRNYKKVKELYIDDNDD